MHALLRGERVGSPIQIVILLVLLLVTCIALSLAVATRFDASDARRSAHADQAALIKVAAALRTQCAQQLAEQTRLRDLERTDAVLQRGLIAADAANNVITDGIRGARRRVYEQKLAKDLEFLSLPPQSPAVCGAFNDIFPIAFRTSSP